MLALCFGLVLEPFSEVLGTQDGPKMVQDGPKMASRWPLSSPCTILERFWAVLGGLGAVFGWCYSHARSVCRGGSRLACWAASFLFICLHRMHGVTVSAAMVLKSRVSNRGCEANVLRLNDASRGPFGLHKLLRFELRGESLCRTTETTTVRTCVKSYPTYFWGVSLN